MSAPLPEWRGGRLAVVMMSALGDAVHVLPLLDAVKRHAPSTHITWVLQPGPAALVHGHAHIDDTVIVRRERPFRTFLDVRRALAERPFDLVLALQVYLKAGIVTALASAPVKLGFDRERARDLNWLVTTARIPPHAPQHVQDQYFEFLDALRVPHQEAQWHLGPREDERARQRAYFAERPRPVAVLVIGASHPQKEWLPERWAELADALDARGLEPVLAGGRAPRELETERAILGRCRHAPLSTLGWPLRDLVWLLDGAALVVSLDTGPMHMAVALDRPVIGLMGYNNPKRVGPYRKFGDLLVDAYGDPGEDYPISIAHRTDRMPRITVAEVLRKVDVWKERYAAV
jgi:heptosyltransferase I